MFFYSSVQVNPRILNWGSLHIVYQFERIWQRPEFYIEKLTEFDCVLTPDFSLYQDMPIAMQIWN
ncbi:DUF4417 domain-containing protein, partial [Streptococcus suis]